LSDQDASTSSPTPCSIDDDDEEEEEGGGEGGEEGGEEDEKEDDENGDKVVRKIFMYSTSDVRYF
jgi:hypothetical protein